MERIIHDLMQGTSSWDEFRLTHLGGSEIAAVLGLSKTTTRTELLRAKKTGIAKEFGDWLQRNVLDRGHQIEALARPLAVEFAGVDGFYPATYSLGRISASTDGVDMLDETAWECKSLNAQNGAIVRAGNVPEEHMPQCQQVLMVTGADRLLFTVSDGTRENTFHAWVEPDTEWFDRIRAAWAQFAVDLETFIPAEPVAEVVGRTPETLPALHIVLKGEVSDSNLAEFKDVALTAIRSVNRDLKTDQDFADSAKARKWCEDIETRVAAAKEHALSQTATIDLLFRTMDEVSAEAREVRLALEKLEKARKESRRGEIVAGGVKAMADHIAALNTRLGKPFMPAVPADFGGSIKNLRTFDSMQNAVDTTLANAKIEANAIADKIQINLTLLRETAKDHAFLFADTAQIVLKENADFILLVDSRIAAHKTAEATKEEALRERLRQEELARIERERVAAEQAAEAKKIAAAAPPSSLTLAQIAKQQEGPISGKDLLNKYQQGGLLVPLPTDVTIPTITQAPVAAQSIEDHFWAQVGPLTSEPITPSGPPTLKLGTIAERLGFNLTADFLKNLGFEPAATDKASKLFHESAFPLICMRLVAHIQHVQARQFAS